MRLAASVLDQPYAGERLISRIHILPRDLSSDRHFSFPWRDLDPARVEAIPLVWTRAGLVVRVLGELALCDPDAGTCRAVWKPPDPFYVVQTVALGDRDLLVGLARNEACRGETRIRELHRLDLSTGRATRVFETPDRTFLSDLDWISTPPDGAATAGGAPTPPAAETR